VNKLQANRLFLYVLSSEKKMTYEQKREKTTRSKFTSFDQFARKKNGFSRTRVCVYTCLLNESIDWLASRQ